MVKSFSVHPSFDVLFIFGLGLQNLCPQQPERSPVSAAETNQTMENQQQVVETPDTDIIDLGFDADESAFKRPVIRGGSYKAEVTFAQRRPSAVKGTLMWNIGLKLTESTKDTQGKEVNPGFTLFYRFLAEPSGKMTQERINNFCERMQFATNGKSHVNSGTWVGKTVQIGVRVREPHTDDSGNSYDESNEVTGVFPVKK